MKFTYFTTFALLLSGVAQTFAGPINIGEARALDNTIDHVASDLRLEQRAGSKATTTPKVKASVPPATLGPIEIDSTTGLKMSPNPSDWPTTAQLDKAIRPPLNQAWFWSGKVGDANGKSVYKTAIATAKSKGGVTIELLLAKAGLIMPNVDKGPAVEKWNTASMLMAKNAQGEVHAVLGEFMRPGNTWDKIEFPTLQTVSKGVTVVKVVHPLTLDKEEVIFNTRRKTKPT